jgi:peptide/nickel transport system ATP-binding protein
MAQPLLEIRNAGKVYGGGLMSKDDTVVALENFSMSVPDAPATITAIAGESGSGKTTLANAVLGFITLTSGQILYRGMDVGQLKGQQRLEFRRQVQAVFQDPYEVYNPFFRVKHIFDLAIRHLKLAKTRSEAHDLIEEALRVVGLRGDEVLEKYPHQLSGGQRQRIMVARAYMLKPRLIVADEPVSAVDASLRASILDVMMHLRDDSGISFLYITHDLSTAYQICDDIYVLYQGAVSETGKASDVIGTPTHPYVQLLINSVPVPDPDLRWSEDIDAPPEETMRVVNVKGCRFYPRCPQRMERCLVTQPTLYSTGPNGHAAACFLYQ